MYKNTHIVQKTDIKSLPRHSVRSAKNNLAYKSRIIPGTTRLSDFYQIIMQPLRDFPVFRYLNVEKQGRIQRVDGRPLNGSWVVQAWLVSKDVVAVRGGKLIPKIPQVKQLLTALGDIRKLVGTDTFAVVI